MGWGAAWRHRGARGGDIGAVSLPEVAAPGEVFTAEERSAPASSRGLPAGLAPWRKACCSGGAKTAHLWGNDDTRRRQRPVARRGSKRRWSGTTSQ
jgi:hypothetical protein